MTLEVWQRLSGELQEDSVMQKAGNDNGIRWESGRWLLEPHQTMPNILYSLWALNHGKWHMVRGWQSPTKTMCLELKKKRNYMFWQEQNVSTLNFTIQQRRTRFGGQWNFIKKHCSELQLAKSQIFRSITSTVPKLTSLHWKIKFL